MIAGTVRGWVWIAHLASMTVPIPFQLIPWLGDIRTRQTTTSIQNCSERRALDPR
jgi:hypothetical protein